jgi:competence ComEA-like helix-hairpin-helix protein
MKFLHHIQSATGATRSEVVVILMLILVVLLGHGLQRCHHNTLVPEEAAVSQQLILRRIDSLLASNEHQTRDTVHTEEQTERKAMRDELQGITRTSRSMATAPIGRINLNTASSTQLQRIPGVGEATAERIIQHRRQSPFRRIEDVMLIHGIGEKKYAKMQPYIIAP